MIPCCCLAHGGRPNHPELYGWCMQLGGAHSFVSHAWLRGGLLAVANQHGEVVIIQDAQQVAVIRLGRPLQCIAALGRGFVVGAADGAIIRFKGEDARLRWGRSPGGCWAVVHPIRLASHALLGLMPGPGRSWHGLHGDSTCAPAPSHMLAAQMAA